MYVYPSNPMRCQTMWSAPSADDVFVVFAGIPSTHEEKRRGDTREKEESRLLADLVHGVLVIAV